MDEKEILKEPEEALVSGGKIRPEDDIRFMRCPKCGANDYKTLSFTRETSNKVHAVYRCQACMALWEKDWYGSNC